MPFAFALVASASAVISTRFPQRLVGRLGLAEAGGEVLEEVGLH